jgi:hypothetical protein
MSKEGEKGTSDQVGSISFQNEQTTNASRHPVQDNNKGGNVNEFGDGQSNLRISSTQVLIKDNGSRLTENEAAKPSSSSSPPPPPPPPPPPSSISAITAITATQSEVPNSSTTDRSDELPLAHSIADFRNGKGRPPTQQDVQNQANAVIYYSLEKVLDAMAAPTDDGMSLNNAAKAIHLGLMARALGLAEQVVQSYGTQGSRRFGGSSTSIEFKTSEATKKTDTGATMPSPPQRPKAVLKPPKPFPDDIIPRLSMDQDVMNSSIDINTFSPATYVDGTWNGMHKDNSCSNITLVLFLMSSKTFVFYLMHTADLSEKPLHYVLLHIMKKFAYGKGCFDINSLGLKEALDTQTHDSPYYTASTDQRDVHELLLQVLNVLMAESNGFAYSPLISFIPSPEMTLESQISLLSSTSSKDLTSIFSFLMLTTRTCTICNVKKFSILPYNSYEVSFPTSFTNQSIGSLSSLIASLMKPTEGERDNYCCKNADAKVTISERMCTFPQVLVIEPYRATQGSLAFAGEIQDVLPPRHTGSIAPEKSITFQDLNNQTVDYDLKSIILHNEGQGAASGHFQIICDFGKEKFQKFDDIGPNSKGTCCDYSLKNDKSLFNDAKNGCFYLYEKRQPAASKFGDEVSSVDSIPGSSLPPSSSSSSSSSSTEASSSAPTTVAGATGNSGSRNKSSKKSSPPASSSKTAATLSSISKTAGATVSTGEATTAMLSSLDSFNPSTSQKSTSTSVAASAKDQGVISSTSLIIDTSMTFESKKRPATTPISTTATGECRHEESNEDGKVPHVIQKRKTNTEN